MTLTAAKSLGGNWMEPAVAVCSLTDAATAFSTSCSWVSGDPASFRHTFGPVPHRDRQPVASTVTPAVTDSGGIKSCSASTSEPDPDHRLQQSLFWQTCILTFGLELPVQALVRGKDGSRAVNVSRRRRVRFAVMMVAPSGGCD
jgi:hypothetical protein